MSPYLSTFRIARYGSLQWGVGKWGLSPRKVKGRDEMVRVLVTVEPRMCREAIALAVQRNRPNSEVMLVSEEVMDGQVKDFAPHVLVRNYSDGEVPEGLLGGVVCRVEVIYADRMAARVSVGGSSYTIEDASIDDLLALVDEAEDLVSG